MEVNVRYSSVSTTCRFKEISFHLLLCNEDIHVRNERYHNAKQKYTPEIYEYLRIIEQHINLQLLCNYIEFQLHEAVSTSQLMVSPSLTSPAHPVMIMADPPPPGFPSTETVSSTVNVPSAFVENVAPCKSLLSRKDIPCSGA